MQELFEEAALRIKRAKSIQVITHIDADGLSAGGIMDIALSRFGKNFEVFSVPGIYKEGVEEFEPADLNIFTDLGSGTLDVLGEKYENEDTIILDHHKPQGKEWKKLLHINPVLAEHDGAREISGAGVSYRLARTLHPSNRDLSSLAVIGAVGDIQNFWGKFESFNEEILKDATEAGNVEVEKDLLVFGRHTRPVYKSLQYFTDPFVPSISNSESGSISFLQHVGVALKDGEVWRSFTDLSLDEKQRIADQMISRAMQAAPQELVHYIPSIVVGDHYTMLDEEVKGELRGAMEFSTALNATGKNGRPDVGFNIARGKRGVHYKALESLLKKHRRNIAKGIGFVEEHGVRTGPNNYVQYFDSGYDVPLNIVGTVAGMTLGSDGTDPYKPMLGFASSERGVKVSARVSRLLVLKGIKMADAMHDTAESVGGIGGGHDVACGAFIPHDKTEEFVEKFEKELLNNG